MILNQKFASFETKMFCHNLVWKRYNLDTPIPTRNYNNDSGFDFFITDEIEIDARKTRIVALGLGVECPPQTFMKIEGRSSLASRGIIVNGGVVDNGYEGELKCILVNATDRPIRILRHEAIAQGILLPLVTPSGIEVIDDPNLNACARYGQVIERGLGPRGNHGFGSTNKQVDFGHTEYDNHIMFSINNQLVEEDISEEEIERIKQVKIVIS